MAAPKVGAAIIGPGNIGTDLLTKLMRSDVVEVRLISGIVPDSPGLQRAAGLGIDTSADGVEAVARSRRRRDRLRRDRRPGPHGRTPRGCAEAGKRAIDLTPAAVGPYVVPRSTWRSTSTPTNVNMVSCGGQATIPIVARDRPRRRRRLRGDRRDDRSSARPGPGTRAEHRRVHRDHGARRSRPSAAPTEAKAIIILNPADPPIIMRDTVFARVRRARRGGDRARRSRRWSPSRAAYVPGYRLVGSATTDGDKVTVMLEIEGAGDFLPAYAGNLDIMTAAAAARRRAASPPRPRWPERATTMPQSPHLRPDVTACATACTRSPTSSRPAQIGEVAAALDPAGIPLHRGLPWRRPRRLVLPVRLRRRRRTGVRRGGCGGDRAGRDRGAAAARDRHDPRCSTRRTSAAPRAVRVATHCTEADISAQHIAWAREHGMFAIGFLMMSHMIEPAELAEQAKLMESYGAEVVYAVDSAGALVPSGARARVAALREAVDDRRRLPRPQQPRLRGRQRAGRGRSGGDLVDGSLRGLGAGAGNARPRCWRRRWIKAGMDTGVDRLRSARRRRGRRRAAPAVARRSSTAPRSCSATPGVYSSFLRHTERAAEKYGVDPREVLLELGRRGVVGGQEDMIIEVAAAQARRAVAG